MKYFFIFKLVISLVALGTMFVIGLSLGAASMSGLTEEGAKRQLDHCVPAEAVEDLMPCVRGE